mgnify:FL=1
MFNYHEISDNEYLPNYTGYDEFIGNFTYTYNHKFISGVLLKLDNFDIGYVKNIVLKNDEILLRYVTDRMFLHGRYYQKPLIKINPVKGLIYYLSNDMAKFETRGIKLNCLNIIIAGAYNNHMRDCMDHLQICHNKTLEMQSTGEIYNYNIT